MATPYLSKSWSFRLYKRKLIMKSRGRNASPRHTRRNFPGIALRFHGQPQLIEMALW